MKTTTKTTTLSPQDRALNDQWVARLNRYLAGDKTAMPPEVVGLGSIARTGHAGHAEADYPIIRGLDGAAGETFAQIQERMPEDVRFAMAQAQRIVDEHNRQAQQSRGGMGAFVTDTWHGDRDGGPRAIEEGGDVIEQINFAKHARIVLPIAISGG